MSTIDTSEMTFAEMKEAHAELEKSMQAAKRAAQKDALAQIVQVAKDHDLTAEDIANAMKGKAKRSSKPKAEPKYKDPNSDATWTGKGRKPNWFVEAEEAGVDTDTMLISAD